MMYFSVICVLMTVIWSGNCTNDTIFLNETDTELPSKTYPPKLNLVNLDQDIPSDSTFEVECFGNKPLEWRITPVYEDLGARVETIESHDTRNAKFQFTNKLILRNAKWSDTALFQCFYNGSDVDELTSNPNTMASFYLFVNDNKNLIARYSYLVKSTTSEPLIIPFRTTNSKTNVTLWKIEGSENIPVHLEKDRIEYDPRKGFIIYYPTIFFSESFKCISTLDKYSQTDMIVLKFQSSMQNEELPKPIIHMNNASHVSQSSSFTLLCIVDFYNSFDVRGHLTWYYPAFNEKDVDRHTTPRHIGETIKDQNGHFIYRWSVPITVKNAKISDQGLYTCVVQVGDNKNNRSVNIIVHEKEPDPYVHLKTDVGKVIRVSENRPVKLVFEVNTTIRAEDLKVYYWKDSEMLESSEKYNITKPTYPPNMHGLYSTKLSFTNATRKDSGNYTIKIYSGEIRDSISTLICVKVPPLTSIISPVRFFEPYRQYELKCLVDGFPAVNIWYMWRKCNITYCDPWVKLSDNSTSENQERLQRIDRTVLYKPERSLLVKATESGEYRCFGQNEFNTTRDTLKFIVSDVTDGFEIIPSLENPIEGDNFTLACLANRMQYTGVKWYSLSQDGSREPLSKEALNDLAESRRDTRYSLASHLNFPKIKLNQAQGFLCVAQQLDGNMAELNISVVVQEAVKPKFLNDKVPKLYSLKTTKGTELNCAVEGAPKPVVTWFKNNLLLRNTSDHVMEINGTVLKIKVAIKKTVEGDYKCKASNREGTIERTFKVVVEQIEDSEISTATLVLAIILPIILILLFIACFCCIRHVHLERLEKAELEALSRELFNKGEVELLNPDLPLDDQVQLLPYDHKWEFPKDRLKLGRILGQGAFGRVVKAEAIGLDEEGTTIVAVKMLKERADKMQRKALMAELKILIHLGKHLNIVNLLGAVTTNMMKGELLVIVEYCRYGNIRNFLLKRKNMFINQLDPETGNVDSDLAALPGSPLKAQLAAKRGLSNPIYGQHTVNYVDLIHSKNSDNSYNVKSYDVSDPRSPIGKSTPFRWLSMNEDDEMLQPITTCDLLCYSYQVARGMQYLSGRKLLHRDLAARNVLLADDNIVKICDFGLAKDCYKCDNYKIQGNGPLPIKWMALESLEDKVFTTKSDIWSFGVLLWEFFTLGGDPYPGTDLDEDFFKRLKNGYRMDKPDFAPINVYRIMLQCWESDPDYRPDFETLGDTFSNFLQAGVKDFYLQLDTQYADMNALNKGTDYLAMTKSDYLSMGEETAPKQTVNYDNVSSVRPIDDGPVSLEPMEVVPMIQLEPVTVHFKKPKGRPALDTPEPENDTRRETDYLMMEGEKSVFSRQRKGNESLRSDASSGFHSDLDTSGETNIPPSYSLVMEEKIGIEV